MLRFLIFALINASILDVSARKTSRIVRQDETANLQCQDCDAYCACLPDLPPLTPVPVEVMPTAIKVRQCEQEQLDNRAVYQQCMTEKTGVDYGEILPQCSSVCQKTNMLYSSFYLTGGLDLPNPASGGAARRRKRELSMDPELDKCLQQNGVSEVDYKQFENFSSNAEAVRTESINWTKVWDCDVHCYEPADDFGKADTECMQLAGIPIPEYPELPMYPEDDSTDHYYTGDEPDESVPGDAEAHSLLSALAGIIHGREWADGAAEIVPQMPQ